ncbi:hypothetical protein GGI12_003405 [Dipsacomyces acuminosporus]|nr:hypothetical protein GGI12_003405 [Dipsacomyces acuminosporus]
MRWTASFQLLFFALQLIRPLHASSEELDKRTVDTSSVSGQRGALLVIDGKQTSCEIALIDNRAGYVATSCLKLKGNQIDYSVKYEVFIDNGPKAAPSKYKIDQIDTSSAYNETTYVYNIAVIQFNKAEKVFWKSPIAKFSTKWNDLYYVRRTLDNVQDIKWNTPVVKAQLKDSDGCSEASGLYKKNPNAFLCIDSGTQSIFNKTCQVPYGSIYAVKQPSDIAIAALYSHSSVYGTDMCGNSRQFHYYTILGDFNSQASGYLGYSISELSPPNDASASQSSFHMNDTAAPSNPDISTFSGDLYPRQGAIPPSAAGTGANTAQTSTSGTSNPAASGSASAPSSAATSSPQSSGSGSGSDSDSGGITRTAIIAIAVAVPVVTILGIVGLFFLYRWWKKRHNEHTWDASQERSNYNAIQIMNEIGGAANRDSELPSYEGALFGDRRTRTSDSKSK